MLTRLWQFVQIAFKGRGVLVVVPPALAPQWEGEIKKESVRRQKVIIVDDATTRRRYLTSKEGMRECAAWSCCYTCFCLSARMRSAWMLPSHTSFALMLDVLSAHLRLPVTVQLLKVLFDLLMRCAGSRPRTGSSRRPASLQRTSRSTRPLRGSA